MRNSKEIILTAIIVIALAIAGFFAYKVFFGSGTSGSATLTTTPVVTAPVKGAILPNGSNLDFDNVKKFNKNGKLFPYPTVTPNDVGQDLSALVNQ